MMQMPGAPVQMPGAPAPTPKSECMTEEGYVYYEDKHPPKTLKKNARKPPIQCGQFMDDDGNLIQKYFSRLVYGGCVWSNVRPTLEQARNAALQFYMRETKQGQEDSHETR